MHVFNPPTALRACDDRPAETPQSAYRGHDGRLETVDLGIRVEPAGPALEGSVVVAGAAVGQVGEAAELVMLGLVGVSGGGLDGAGHHQLPQGTGGGADSDISQHRGVEAVLWHARDK